MATQDKVLATVSASAPRRFFAMGVLGLLGLLLIYIAFSTPPETLGWQIFLIAFGAFAVWAAVVLGKATQHVIELTSTELRESSGRVLCRVEDIEDVSRGVFAMKPSNGFLIKVKNAERRAWAPGLWWRLAGRIGVGGVTAASQSKVMSEIIAALLAERMGTSGNNPFIEALMAAQTKPEAPSDTQADSGPEVLPEADADMPLEERVVAGMLGWLSMRDPDDWHEVAISYNWDRSIEPLLWMLAQPTCDQATVATLFWRASPADALSHADLEAARKAYNGKGFEVVQAIIAQLNAGGYTRAEIAFEGHKLGGSVESWQARAEAAGLTGDLPAWLWEKRGGRDLSEPRYTEGLPRPIVEWVFPDWEEGWGD